MLEISCLFAIFFISLSGLWFPVIIIIWILRYIELDFFSSQPFIRGDRFSWVFTGITIWIFLVIFLKKIVLSKRRIIFLMFFLVLTFNSNSLILIYFWFEVRVILIAFLIIKERSEMARFSAFFSILVYSLISSVPLLYFVNRVRNGFLLVSFSEKQRFFVFLVLIIRLVKVPFFFFHAWLLKAHVEASIEGSIVLAGIILKLGSFTFRRFYRILSVNTENLKFLVILWRIIGAGLSSLIINFQRDLKKMIALSSVSHIGLSTGRLVIRSPWGADARILSLISHSFIASILFFLATLSYKKVHSRNMILIGSFITFRPLLGLILGVRLIFNAGVPPALGFFSEVIIGFSLIRYSFFWAPVFLIFSLALMRASLLIFFQLNKGSQNKILNLIDLRMKDRLCLFIQGSPCVFFIFLPFL